MRTRNRAYVLLSPFEVPPHMEAPKLAHVNLKSNIFQCGSWRRTFSRCFYIWMSILPGVFKYLVAQMLTLPCVFKYMVAQMLSSPSVFKHLAAHMLVLPSVCLISGGSGIDFTTCFYIRMSILPGVFKYLEAQMQILPGVF